MTPDELRSQIDPEGMIAERKRRVPAALWHASETSPHLAAAVSLYVLRGDVDAWRRAYDAMRADCDRMDAESATDGAPTPTPFPAWEDEALAPGDALTPGQCASLRLMTAAHRGLVAGAVRRVMMRGVPVIRLDALP